MVSVLFLLQMQLFESSKSFLIQLLQLLSVFLPILLHPVLLIQNLSILLHVFIGFFKFLQSASLFELCVNPHHFLKIGIPGFLDTFQALRLLLILYHESFGYLLQLPL